MGDGACDDPFSEVNDGLFEPVRESFRGGKLSLDKGSGSTGSAPGLEPGRDPGRDERG